MQGLKKYTKFFVVVFVFVFLGTGCDKNKTNFHPPTAPMVINTNTLNTYIPPGATTTPTIDNKPVQTISPIDIGPTWDYVSLTPEIFNRIIQKIKSAPNAEIKATKTGEQGSLTFYYSFVAHDPCEPLLKDFLVFEIETTTDVDENGKSYPGGPITDYYSMRDTDHDTYPEDYFTPGEPIHDVSSVCDPRVAYLPFTKGTVDGSEMLSFWEAGMNYFAANLLK